MIKNISVGGKYIIVSGLHPETYINTYSNAHGVGNMRYNTTLQNIEVWDGNTWIMLKTSSASIGLSHEAEDLLDWAKEKRRQKESMLPLSSDHPAVRIAKENLNKAKAEVIKAEQQLKATIILSKDEQTTS